jgi:hypothetical protein
MPLTVIAKMPAAMVRCLSTSADSLAIPIGTSIAEAEACVMSPKKVARIGSGKVEPALLAHHTSPDAMSAAARSFNVKARRSCVAMGHTGIPQGVSRR